MSRFNVVICLKIKHKVKKTAYIVINVQFDYKWFWRDTKITVQFGLINLIFEILLSALPLSDDVRNSGGACGSITIWSPEEGGTAVLSRSTPTRQPTTHEQLYSKAKAKILQENQHEHTHAPTHMLVP